jgi:outer membrane immunogenic protein
MRSFALAMIASVAAASPVLAADLPSSAPPPPRAPVAFAPPPPPFSWTGIYIGGNIGWGWTDVTLTDTGPDFNIPPGPVFPLGTQNTLSQNGFLGGAQLGFNYQISQFVVGLEGDFDYTAIDNNQSAGAFGGADYKDPWTATFDARFGVALDRALLYGKAGGAWMQEKYNVTAPDGSALTGTFGRWGWTVGAGLEYAILNNLTAKVEYDFMDFGSQNQSLTPNATDLVTGNVTGDANKSQLTASVIKVGVNFLFH